MASPTENKEPLIDKVRRSIEGQGYPLEMRTARAFQQAGARAEVGQFYIDPDSDEPREIDVIATFEFGSPSKRNLTVSFVVECKSSTKESWVMFTTNGSASAGALPTRVFHSSGGAVVDRLKDWVPTRSIDLTGNIAYSASKVIPGKVDKEGPDSVFKAILSATKAAYWLAISEHASGRRFHVVFPVIVVDAPVFSCSLPDASDDLDIAAIQSGLRLRWARPLGGRKLTVIDVVPADDLPRYVDESASMARDLAQEYARNVSLP